MAAKEKGVQWNKGDKFEICHKIAIIFKPGLKFAM